MNPIILFDGHKISDVQLKDIPDNLLNKGYNYWETEDGELETKKLFPDGKVGFCGFLYFNGTQIVSLPKYECREGLCPDAEALMPKIDRLAELLFHYRDYLEQRDSLYQYCVTHQPGDNLILLYKKLRGDYFRRGIYKKDAVVPAPKGRIDWHATVSRKKAFLSGDAPFYRNPLRKRKVFAENEVSEIEKAVLNYISERNFLGSKQPSFSDAALSMGEIQSDLRKYLRLLEREKRQAHRDDDVKLILLLMRILQSELIAAASADKADPHIFAVANFEFIFEKLLGDYFGNELVDDLASKTEVDSDFSLQKINRIGQTIQWHLKGPLADRIDGIENYTARKLLGNFATADDLKYTLQKDTARPDAVYRYQNECLYILDAKYHQLSIWSIKQQERDELRLLDGLPNQSADIYKQYYYAEMLKHYVQEKNSPPENRHLPTKIQNVFVLPKQKEFFDRDEKKDKKSDEKADEKLICAGYNERGDERIYLVFADTYRMMQDIISGNFDVEQNRKELARVIGSEGNS